jgi:drug/metabolite transporter (DMT)-like permease
MDIAAVVIFGWMIFHETLNPMQISGCLLILFSGILKTVTDREKSASERP